MAAGARMRAAGPFTDGARLVVRRSGGEVAITRAPEADNLVLIPRAALEGFVTRTLPTAQERLVALGFGLPQQGEEAGLNRAIDFWSD